jgi:hypothetical protein
MGDNYESGAVDNSKSYQQSPFPMQRDIDVVRK